MKPELTQADQTHINHGKAFARVVATAMKAAGLTGVRIKNKGLEHNWFSASIKSDQMLDVLITSRTISFVHNKQVTTHALGSIVLDYAGSKHAKPTDGALFRIMQAKIRTALKKKYGYVPEYGSPWYFETTSRTTLGNDSFKVGVIKVEADTSEEQPWSPPYDPHAAYLARQTPAAQARQARIAQSQFADSYGGCSSNYRY